MSIMSVSRPDASTSMYKHFASLISSYVDAPANSVGADAAIPIESIFKLLEMYRFNAFKDESRRGALALRANGHLSRISKTPSWHGSVLNALNNAKIDTFGAETSTEDAVIELETVLKKLTKNQALEENHKANTRNFVVQFGNSLG